MADLKYQEKKIFEKIFDRDGYVLDFTDRTFKDFFNDFNISIDDDKYRVNGNSKMKRLRTFWKIENSKTVGKVLENLLEIANSIEEMDSKDYELALKYIHQMQGKKISEENTNKNLTEDEFLKKEFSKINISLLGFDYQLEKVIKQRLEEIQISLNGGASLSVIFLCGSTLEGLLLNVATKNVQKFNTSKSAPKDNNSKVKELHKWTLDSLINVAYENNFIKLDIKKFSHSLKDFRNYIHPRQQASQDFIPDKHTAKISWQVLQATIANLIGDR